MSAGRQGSKIEPQELHLEGPRPGACRGGVDPLAEALEQGAQLGVERLFLAQRRAPYSQRPHQPVDRQPLRSGDLGDSPADDPAIEVHLPEAVLPVAEALGEPDVGGGAGLYVGDAPAVAPHPHPALEPIDLDRPLLLGQRPARQPVPGERPSSQPPGRCRPLPPATRPALRAFASPRPHYRSPCLAGQPARKAALGLELLQVSLHDDRSDRAELVGDVVPDLGQQRLAGALAAVEGGEEATLAHLAVLRRTRRASPRGRLSRGRAPGRSTRSARPGADAATPCRRPASRRRAGRRSSPLPAPGRR